MDRPPEPLTLREHALLVELVRHRAPELLPLATKAVKLRWLTDEEVEALSDVASAEFMEHLSPGDEPDQVGAAADDLMEPLQRQRKAFWD